MKMYVLVVMMFVCLTMRAGIGGLEECRRHATPQGWSDDITASMAKAKAEGKDLFVYFPLYHDDVWFNGKVRLDFWNAREDKIRKLQSADRKLSRKEAGLQATIAMRQEWQPKFEKLIKLAPKVLPKLLDEFDRKTVEGLKCEAEAYMKVWSGASTTVPYF